MKNISKVVLMTIVMTMMTMTAVYAAPVKIALLPVLNYQNFTNLDMDGSDALYKRIKQEVHVPLNGVLQRTEEIDRDDAAMIFNHVLGGLRAENKKAKLAEAIAPTAEQLNADILILPVARNCRQQIYYSTRGERVLICYANLDMYVFNNATGDLQVYRASESFESSYDSAHNLPSSILRCAEKVLSKANLRQLISNN